MQFIARLASTVTFGFRNRISVNCLVLDEFRTIGNSLSSVSPLSDLQPSRIPSLKKLRLVHYLIVIGLLVVLATVVLVYRQTSLRKPTENLLTLLPEDPICFVAAKNLTDAVEAFKHSPFGRRAAQMPIFAEIRRQRQWRQILYQKQLWEHEMGGEFNFKKLKGYLGEEAILALYRQEDKISFLLISVVGAKEKLEIAAITATDAFNPTYKRLQNDYGGFTINTITGYPRDFSYAFIGRIGLLAFSQSLIKESIDIYAKKKKGFGDLHPMRQSLQKRYVSHGSTVFVDFPKLFTASGFAREFMPLFEGIETWTCCNRYWNGTIQSHNRIRWKSLQERRPSRPQTINPNLLSLLPSKSAVLYTDRTISPLTFWRFLASNLMIQHEQREMQLAQHLGEEVTIALIDTAHSGPVKTPSVIAAIPITNRIGLEADLTRLQGHRIVVDGKHLQFGDSQTYRGVAFRPVQLRLGFLFSLKGAYALVNDYWIIGTTVSGLRSVIDASMGEYPALSEIQFPEPATEPRDCHLLIQPNLLFSELRSYMPILGLMAPLMGNTFDFRLIQRTIANLAPLETLGPMSAGVDFDSEGMNVEIQVTIPVGNKS